MDTLSTLRQLLNENYDSFPKTTSDCSPNMKITINGKPALKDEDAN